MVLHTATVIRKCSVCRLTGHMINRCPVNTAGNIPFGCKKRSCGPCAALCEVCDVTGHQPDNIDELVVGRAVPRWSCADHDMGEMAARVTPLLPGVRPTVRAQKEAARDNKRKLAATRPTDGERFRAHVAQSGIIDLTGLGGAAASAAVRMASSVAAVAEDAGATRGASRAVGAYVSDVNGQSSGGTTAPIPGTLGNIDLDGRRADVVALIEEAMRKAPKYSPSARGSHRCRNREAGLGGGGSPASEEVLGSSNPYFGVTGKEIKRAAQRYVSLAEGKELSMVKLAMAKLIGKGRVYTGASVTCGELTCKHVSDELMECAKLVGLTVPSVLASLPQFVVEMRRGDDDLARFFEHPPERPSTAGSAASN